MSQTTISSLPSPSRSKKRTFETTGSGGLPGGLSARLTNLSPPSSAGHGGGSGSITGEWDSK